MWAAGGGRSALPPAVVKGRAGSPAHRAGCSPTGPQGERPAYRVRTYGSRPIFQAPVRGLQWRADVSAAAQTGPAAQLADHSPGDLGGLAPAAPAVDREGRGFSPSRPVGPPVAPAGACSA